MSHAFVYFVESTNAPMSHAAGLRNVRIVQFKLADIGEGIRDVTLKEWLEYSYYSVVCHFVILH